VRGGDKLRTETQPLEVTDVRNYILLFCIYKEEEEVRRMRKE